MQADVGRRPNQASLDVQLEYVEGERAERGVRAAKTGEPDEPPSALRPVGVPYEFVGQAEYEAADDVDDERADRPGPAEPGVGRLGRAPPRDGPDRSGGGDDDETKPKRGGHA